MLASRAFLCQALSSNYNDEPKSASRAFDNDRDGFVFGAGGGIVVLEELEHAKARGAKIYGEVVGYGANSDGYDMVAPSGEGACAVRWSTSESAAAGNAAAGAAVGGRWRRLRAGAERTCGRTDACWAPR